MEDIVNKLIVLTCALALLAGAAIARSPGEKYSYTVRSGNDDSGWLGVSIQDMTRRLSRSMKVKTEEGALVNEVVKDSPAESAGIKEEDIIVEFDGKAIYDAGDLTRAVKRTKPGATANVIVMRNDERRTLKATIGKPSRRERSRAFAFSVPPVPRFHMFSGHVVYGLTLRDLNEQLGEYFGAPGGRGVLVEEVEKESAGDKVGFRAGDVIVKADKQTVEESRDLIDVLDDRKEGEKVDVEVIRKGSRTSLTLTVEEESGHRWHGFGRGPRSEFFHDFDFEFPTEELEGLEDKIELEMDRMRPELDKLRENLRRIRLELPERRTL